MSQAKPEARLSRRQPYDSYFRLPKNACQGTFPENRIFGATNAGNRHRAGSMQAKARLTVNARGVVENADEVLVIRRDSCGIHTHGFMTPTCWFRCRRGL